MISIVSDWSFHTFCIFYVWFYEANDFFAWWDGKNTRSSEKLITTLIICQVLFVLRAALDDLIVNKKYSKFNNYFLKAIKYLEMLLSQNIN